ncbi:MAG: hypothetical protein JWO73_769 [Candidatus Taylorbacteria bacterium]|nr:hypothetical protein [Candidatus Taylorbacteria bacterium]
MKNRIRHTVTNYIGRRPPKNRPPKKKKQPESNFVRFMNSLENRGPLSMHSMHVQWTRKVRSDMEASMTWLRGMEQCSLPFVAEYMSRVLREFWLSNIPLLPEKWDRGDAWKLKHVKDMLRIFKKMQAKGRRDARFELYHDKYFLPLNIMYLGKKKRTDETIRIRPQEKS